MSRVAPTGWHTVTPRIVVEDPAGLIGFLTSVFDATGELRDDAPSVITIGDSPVMISGAELREACPAFLYVYVEDVDAVYSRALDAGAVSVEAVWNTPYGDRRGMLKDPWGNTWQVATRVVR
jgi:PhnB protein